MAEWRIPYQSAPPGTPPRPYLVLHLTGPNGRSGDVPGIVDSGADQTSLPIGFASLMGYSPPSLERRVAQTPAGETSTFVARQPVAAQVVGLPDPKFELWPMFTANSATALWGRKDFFMVFAVLFDEPAEQFVLITRD